MQVLSHAASSAVSKKKVGEGQGREATNRCVYATYIYTYTTVVSRHFMIP